MVKTLLVMHADENKTVEDLMRLNPTLGGKNYLDLDSGDIVRLVEEPVKEEIPKKKTKK